MAAQREVMITFFSAFAGFSAFGAVIATFLASSNALPRLAASWVVTGTRRPGNYRPARTGIGRSCEPEGGAESLSGRPPAGSGWQRS